MTAHYFQGRYADGAVPVAWVTSGFPVELLRPLGFHTVYPENHAAICGVQRLVPELSDAVEAQGYSRDLCSYVRTDLGSVAHREDAGGPAPAPDLLACCTNICQTVLYWYRDAGRATSACRWSSSTRPSSTASRHAAPARLRARPARGAGSPSPSGSAARPLDPEALVRGGARWRRRARDLWGECLATGRTRPAPWTGIDGFFHMAPIVALRGTEACNAYYRLLRDELQRPGGARHRRPQARSGTASSGTTCPSGSRSASCSTLLAERGFNFVCTSYTNAWAEAGGRIDPADPIGSAATTYTHIILNQDLPNRLGILRRLARDYAVRRRHPPQRPLLQALLDRPGRPEGAAGAASSGIRVLLLEADHNDPRAWASGAGREPARAPSWRASGERGRGHRRRRGLDHLQGGGDRRRGAPSSPAASSRPTRASSGRWSGSWRTLRGEAGRGLPVGATGYGRKRVPGGPRPHRDHLPRPRRLRRAPAAAAVLVDMGGQDTKVIRIGAGRRRDRLRHERQVRRRDRALPRGDPGAAARAVRGGRRARWPRRRAPVPGLQHLHRLRRERGDLAAWPRASRSRGS